SLRLVVDAVNQRADGMLIGGSVNIDGNGRILRRYCRDGQQQHGDELTHPRKLSRERGGVKHRDVAAYVSALRVRLPDLAAFSLLPHHGIAGLATKGALELWQIAQRADHAVLANGVRIGENHLALGFGTNSITARLSPSDEELLLGGEAVNVGRARLAFHGFLQSAIGEFDPA